MTALAEKRCQPCEGGVTPMNEQQVDDQLQQLSGWVSNSDHKEIYKDFAFKGFYKTMAFVNAVAWIANRENHHPDLEVGYGHCLVRYSTHSIGGLSENDFICAAKIDLLLTKTD
ncbi:MAG: 4a-hydroxytetrahydrobiopterin dehydratase [Gammaproteobacteria bacterium]|nr:4a-hydroxytetrahydrobiopterin dehydratase [Gammaproteobacteria bacterium]